MRARARAEDTDWARIAALYEPLAALAPSPVVELNRAVAVGMAVGPQAGLDLVDALASEPTLKTLSPAARACAATCWPSSAGSTRPAASSSARRR